MAEPILTFLYNHGSSDTSYSGTGEEVDDWKIMNPSTDTVVFTGGGILGLLPTPTCASGTRDATIRPSVTSYVIPQTYIEDGTTMYNVPLVGNTPNRYPLAVYVNGTCTSDIYLEAWDDFSFSTTVLQILTGTSNSGNNSLINAIRTTAVEPPWHPGWSGSDTGAAYLRGVEDRIGLNNTSIITDSTVFYNIYVRLETDCSTFHVLPCLSLRYLYT